MRYEPAGRNKGFFERGSRLKLLMLMCATAVLPGQGARPQLAWAAGETGEPLLILATGKELAAYSVVGANGD
ncbi:MAG: hypothetical protein ACR2IE_16400 [Candidatus Sumerlaeaceae bacterium]